MERREKFRGNESFYSSSCLLSRRDRRWCLACLVPRKLAQVYIILSILGRLIARHWHTKYQLTTLKHHNILLVFLYSYSIVSSAQVKDRWIIRAIDFANITAAPLDADLDTTDWDGDTSKVEILHVANIIYSISRWEEIQTDCVFKKEWPVTNTFPASQDLVLGQIISQAATSVW